MLTTSSAEEDILRSYKLHANAYVTKPVDLDQFMNAVRQIDEFFVQVVRLPRASPASAVQSHQAWDELDEGGAQHVVVDVGHQGLTTEPAMAADMMAADTLALVSSRWSSRTP